MSEEKADTWAGDLALDRDDEQSHDRQNEEKRREPACDHSDDEQVDGEQVDDGTREWDWIPDGWRDRDQRGPYRNWERPRQATGQ